MLYRFIMPTSLADTTFVVIDLETSGGSPASAGITEIGAVKVQAGVVLGEYESFINPGHSLPSFITSLTGITDEILRDAPSIEHTLPSLLAFIGMHTQVIVVAHNAPFDIGFLKAAAIKAQIQWPPFHVIDTVRIARHVLTLDEVPNCQLSTLAKFFGTKNSPSHRALDDARATVEVLHGIIDRLGSHEITTIEALKKLNRQRSPRLM